MIDGKPLSKGELWEEYSTNLHDAYNAMRRAFKRSGLTQDAVAQKLGADKGLTSRRLNGSENLTLRTLSFLASALGCRLTIDFVPYESVGAVEQSGTAQSAAWPKLSKHNDTTDDFASAGGFRKAA